MPEANVKTLTSEFIGTFLLVFTVGCNTVIGASGQWAALSIASVLMVSIYALGAVSGGMFNPAVALAVFLNGAKATEPNTVGNMLAYMAVQLFAGVVAGLTSLWVHGNAMNLEPGAGYSYGGAAMIEIIYTFMLCFVVLKAAVHAPADREYFGLAIGFVIVAGGYAGGFISKGAFNPAVALGVDVGSAGQGVYWSLLYTVYELVGACLAVGVHKATDVAEGGSATTAQKAISEMVGTFFLVFTVGCNVLGGSPAPALSIGASLMCMIYALGGVSGAHFNPAVTLALTLIGKCGGSDVAVYMGSQVFGAIVAGVAYSTLIGESVPLAPGANYGWTACAMAEIIYTFVLCFVVMNVAALDGTKMMSEGGASKHIYGLAIGFCIVAGGYAIGAVSGGSLNPAVSVGLDVSDMLKGGSIGNCAAYTLFECVGAALAAGAFMTVRPTAKAGERKPLMQA